MKNSKTNWIKALPAHLRIIIINNGGGNIFKIIPGPDSTNQLEDYFEAAHDHSAEGMAATFGLPYMFCDNETELEKQLIHLYNSDFESAPILEIKTPKDRNDQVLKKYLKFVSN